jgi:hypothetical protein
MSKVELSAIGSQWAKIVICPRLDDRTSRQPPGFAAQTCWLGNPAGKSAMANPVLKVWRNGDREQHHCTHVNPIYFLNEIR